MILMIVATIAALLLRPTHKIADDDPNFDLEVAIPNRFDDWHIVKAGTQIINPQQTAEITRIYDQTLSRTYVNSGGSLVMLSIAYGRDQSDSHRLHSPEVCYPAQGFSITKQSLNVVSTMFGKINVKRLVAQNGSRVEPLIFWTTVGSKAVITNKDSKIAKLQYNLRGEIPDGLLFRVSSIKNNTDAAFHDQEDFINKLLIAVPEEYRLKIAGL